MTKVGDYVKVKCGDATKRRFGCNDEMRAMEELCCVSYKTYEVEEVEGDRIGVLSDTGVIWNFDISDVTKIERGRHYSEKDFCLKGFKVIFNGPATILYKDNERFITKAYNEDFDEEKGLCMALLRYFGMSYLDFKRILATATRQKKSKKETTNKTENKIDKPSESEGIIVVSPKGRHRGKPFAFSVGDTVIIRDCNYYDYVTNATAKGCLNQIFEITKDESDFSGSMYIVNGCEFSGSELEPAPQK